MDRKTALIAVVDDEEIVRSALKRLLRSAGLEVVVFASGEELLSVIAKWTPDCIVLDLHMPGLSGFDVLDRLPAGSPVVAITGHDSPEAQARAARASSYLLKPVDGGALLDAITAGIRETISSKSPSNS